MAVDPRTVRLLLTLIAVALFVAIAAAEALEVLHLDAGRAWDAALLLAGALAGQLTLRHSAEPDATEVPGVSFTEGGH